MHPILLEIGPLTLYTYGTVLAVALLISIGLARYLARRWPQEDLPIASAQLIDLISLIVLGGIAGGRLFFVILHGDMFLDQPLELFAIWHGGLVWYGGFLGGLIAAWWYVRAQKLSFLRVLDFLVPFVAFGHAIGRLGCFFNGCCLGKFTQSWCAVYFPGELKGRLPTQLLEAVGLLSIYVFLRVLQQPRNLKHPGRIFGWYLIAYGLLRFSVEFLRADQPILWLGGTLPQMISLGLLVMGGWLVCMRRRI